MLLLFSIALFLSAALLFAVQPMFGRMVLPLLGGSPSVWNTVMVFYQATLLAGYGCAHALGRRGPRWWIAHLLLMVAALALLPLRLGPGQIPPGDGNPVVWLLWTMTITVGLPFLLLSMTAPLLQRWFAHTGHAHARDPYFLYTASNVGSMLGLLAYPFVIEPRLTLAEQSRLWAIGYAALIALIGVCALATRRRMTASDAANARPEADAPALVERVDWRRRVRWLALAFAPSSLMLGVTTHLSMDLVAMPLLWIIPLAIYLSTFILAFAKRTLIPAGLASRLLVFAVLGVLLVLVSRATEPLWLVLGLHLAALFAAGVVCHGSLAHNRPSVLHLTEFYVWVAAGGALGGAFNALLAPLLFRSVAEYPFVLVLVCMLAPAWSPGASSRRGTPGQLARQDSDGSTVLAARPTITVRRDVTIALIFIAIVAAVVFGGRALGHDWRRIDFVLLLAILCFPLFAFRRRPVRFGLALGGVMLMSSFVGSTEQRTLYAERSFFGIHRVQTIQTSEGKMHQLVHGTTVHGMQWAEPNRCDEPLSYHHRRGPAGQVFATLGHAPRTRNVGVVGLGAGALSAYAEPGQTWTYFEIDPAVVRIASNSTWFCYLDRSKVVPHIVLGDARLRLEADTVRFDLLAVDAYTSDAIPVHLLTREAFQLYFDRLAPHGVLVVHLSNRYFDLEPVVGRIAREAGLVHRINSESGLSQHERVRGHVASYWAVIAREERDLGALIEDTRWKELRDAESKSSWTDGYSSLVSVLR